MSKMLEVRREFGEPFVEVVRGYAAMGYSQQMTAQVLGFNRSYFRQLLQRFDLLGCFNRPQRELVKVCRPGGRGCQKGASRPRAPRYSDEELLAEVRRYPVSTLFEAMSDVSVSTVYRRFGSFPAAVHAAHSAGGCRDAARV